MTESTRSMVEKTYNAILAASADRREACQRLLQLIAANKSATRFYKLMPQLRWLLENPKLVDQLQTVSDRPDMRNIDPSVIEKVITEKLGEDPTQLPDIAEGLAFLRFTRPKDRPIAAQEAISQ